MQLAGLGVVVMGLAVAAALAGIQYLIGRKRPKELAGDHGTLQLNNSVIGVAILIAWGLGCAAVVYHLTVAPSLLAIAVALVCLVSVPVLATAFSSTYDISWSMRGITGPTTLRHPPFSPERREILFDDMVAAGEDRWGNYFVEGSDGTCIRWNWFYNGYPELMAFVEDLCPHLFPELDADEKAAAGGAARFAPWRWALRLWQIVTWRASLWREALRGLRLRRAESAAGQVSAGE